MTLALTFALLTVGLAAFLGGLTLFLQKAFYNDPPERLPLRALVGGLALSLFLTAWAYLNTRASHADRFGTLLEFSATAAGDIKEFRAVKRTRFTGPDGRPREEESTYRRAPGVNGRMLEAGTLAPFRRSTADYMVVALILVDGERESRFETSLDGERFRPDGGYVTYKEVGGSRLISDENPARLLSPSTWGLIAAILINLLHYAVWLAVLWPVMRFLPGHAVVLTLILATTTMLLLVPMLFLQNAMKLGGAAG